MGSFGNSMREFPRPWRPEKVPGGYAVRDAAGTLIAHIFGRDGTCKTEESPPALTMDEAKAMALTLSNAAEVLIDQL